MTDWAVDFASLPRLFGLPFAELLRDMVDAKLDPDTCAALFHRVNGTLERPVLRPEACHDGGRMVTDDVLYPTRGPYAFAHECDGRQTAFAVDEGDVPRVAEFFRSLGRGEPATEHRDIIDDPTWETLIAQERRAPGWQAAHAPGIYRREHASLLIRSLTTSVVIDPIALQRRFPFMAGCPWPSPQAPVDAVLLSHGHDDHWHLPSLLAAARDEQTLVVTPRVEAESLLTFCRFGPVLEACHQRVVSPSWGESLVVGDIEIHVLPFYGEQPARAVAAPRGVRNQGNCYWLKTPQLSCAVLVDSGADPAGDMATVLAETRARLGPVDAVLACLREFESPFFGGLSHYWAALQFSELRHLFAEYRAGCLPATTAGVSGAAQACAAADAKYFLPYANGFEGVGQPINDIGWGLGEPSELRQREALAARVACSVVPWVCGDRWPA